MDKGRPITESSTAYANLRAKQSPIQQSRHFELAPHGFEAGILTYPQHIKSSLSDCCHCTLDLLYLIVLLVNPASLSHTLSLLQDSPSRIFLGCSGPKTVKKKATNNHKLHNPTQKRVLLVPLVIGFVGLGAFLAHQIQHPGSVSNDLHPLDCS